MRKFIAFLSIVFLLIPLGAILFGCDEGEAPDYEHPFSDEMAQQSLFLLITRQYSPGQPITGLYKPAAAGIRGIERLIQAVRDNRLQETTEIRLQIEKENLQRPAAPLAQDQTFRIFVYDDHGALHKDAAVESLAGVQFECKYDSGCDCKFKMGEHADIRIVLPNHKTMQVYNIADAEGTLKVRMERGEGQVQRDARLMVNPYIRMLDYLSFGAGDSGPPVNFLLEPYTIDSHPKSTPQSSSLQSAQMDPMVTLIQDRPDFADAYLSLGNDLFFRGYRRLAIYAFVQARRLKHPNQEEVDASIREVLSRWDLGPDKSKAVVEAIEKDLEKTDRHSAAAKTSGSVSLRRLHVSLPWFEAAVWLSFVVSLISLPAWILFKLLRRRNPKRFSSLYKIAKLSLLSWIVLVLLLVMINASQIAERDRQKGTMSEMRSIATAVEEYAIDNNSYPRARNMEELARQLESGNYIKHLPRTDAWGNAFVYLPQSDFGKGPQGYLIASPARNGRWERQNVERYLPSATWSFDDDMVYANGSFVRYPEGDQC